MNLGQSRSVLLLLNSSFLGRGLLLNLRRLDIVLGCIKIDLNIRLHTTDLIVRLRVHDVDRVVTASILNVNRVTFVKDRVMRQLLLQAKKVQKRMTVKHNICKSRLVGTYMALGLDRSIKAVSWGLILT